MSHECIAPCDRVILYLHGGGYTAGQLDYAKGFGGLLAAATRISVFCVAYRLAPENKFPAALDALEACTATCWIRVSTENIAFTGESAGGGLEYCLLLRCGTRSADAEVRGRHLTMDGFNVFGRVFQQRFARPDVDSRVACVLRAGYAAGHERGLTFPVFGDMEGAAQIAIFVGSDEILFDDKNH